MRIRNFRIHNILEGVAMLCLCLALAGIIIFAATGSTAGATAKGPLPEIKEFSATPMVLPDGQAALYTFSVGGATKIEVIEAGDIIKEVNGPASANIKGTIKGRTTYQIRTGVGNTFDTALIAINSNGKQVKKLTLSFASVIPSGTASTASGQAGPTDNATGARSPKWLALVTSPVLSTLPAGFSQSTWPPQFAKCSTDCNYCLRPEDAKDRGFSERCSDQPCYYSPDKQQTWYCYSKPATVWCCKDGKVVETAKEKCVEAGGTIYATEAEALKACPQLGYCCQNGRLTSATTSTCKNAGGTFYTDPNQAAAACQPPGYCCVNGQLSTTTASACRYAGGTFYTDQAQARACYQQSTCWCCAGGKAFQTTQSSCINSGGSCYTTQSQAQSACYRTTQPIQPIRPYQPPYRPPTIK